MHANGNQIMEGKVLDEQVKIRIFEAFRQSCFLFDETSGQCAYMGSVRKCDELSFFHFLSFDDRKLDDLSVDPESQLHIFHRFHDSREIFSDNRS